MYPIYKIFFYIFPYKKFPFSNWSIFQPSNTTKTFGKKRTASVVAVKMSNIHKMVRYIIMFLLKSKIQGSFKIFVKISIHSKVFPRNIKFQVSRVNDHPAYCTRKSISGYGLSVVMWSSVIIFLLLFSRAFSFSAIAFNSQFLHCLLQSTPLIFLSPF